MSTDAPLTVNADNLPSDVKLLKSLVAELAQLLQTRDERIAQLQRHMDLLVRKMYGRSSEKLAPGRALPLRRSTRSAASSWPRSPP